MNRTPPIVLGMLASAGLFGAAILVAGPLNPPAGPVASSYRTLAEVEPGIPVGPLTPGDATAVYKITAPGRYILTANLVGQPGMHGLVIDASGVTLDLRGFEVQGVAGSLDGIRIIPGRTGITVRGGSIRDWDDAGLNAVGGPNADACLFQDLTLIGNGDSDADYALDVGGASSIVNCMTFVNAGTGIRGNNGTLISGCTASGNGGDGIICGAGTVRDCLVRGNAYDGIRVGAASVVSGCSATANQGAGITIHSGCVATNNACSFNGWGMYIYEGGSRMEANAIHDNTIGVEAFDPGNFIVRNTFTNNDTTEIVAPGNDVGPFESAASGTSPWANLRQ